MNKTKKKKRNHNAEIVEKIAEKYGFSIDYVRKCLRGDRKGLMADAIIKDYKRAHALAERAMGEILVNL